MERRNPAAGHTTRPCSSACPSQLWTGTSWQASGCQAPSPEKWVISKELSGDMHSALVLPLCLLPWNQNLAVGLCCEITITPRKVSEETSCFCLGVSDFLTSEPLPCCLSLVLEPALSSELLPYCCLSPGLSIESITLPINAIPQITYFSVCLGHPPTWYLSQRTVKLA